MFNSYVSLPEGIYISHCLLFISKHILESLVKSIGSTESMGAYMGVSLARGNGTIKC